MDRLLALRHLQQRYLIPVRVQARGHGTAPGPLARLLHLKQLEEGAVRVAERGDGSAVLLARWADELHPTLAQPLVLFLAVVHLEVHHHPIGVPRAAMHLAVGAEGELAAARRLKDDEPVALHLRLQTEYVPIERQQAG